MIDFRKWLVYCFAFLGPLGTIPVPHFFPNSFRAYYFLLPLFPFLFQAAKGKHLKIALLFIPFFLFCFVSATIVELYTNPKEPYPLFRFFLLLFQFLFVVSAASLLTREEEITGAIELYTKSFLLSLSFGYFQYFGFYLQWIPIELLDRFSVETQFGYGLLRFSPGSYPNEYGIVSSFVLSLFTLKILEKQGSMTLYLYWALTFIALMLTTTRTAYIAYGFSFFYLQLQRKNSIKTLLKTSIIFLILFLAIKSFGLNLFSILFYEFGDSMETGSLIERFSVWKEVSTKGFEQPFFGLGFASITNTHNVYLQLIFELGILGSLALFVTIVAISIEAFFIRKKTLISSSLKTIKIIGLIHVLLFALTNHNINHHLTWFVCFLCLISPLTLNSFSGFIDPKNGQKHETK